MKKQVKELMKKKKSEIDAMKEKHEQEMKLMNEKMNQIMSMILQNPLLAHVKPDVLAARKVI